MTKTLVCYTDERFWAKNSRIRNCPWPATGQWVELCLPPMTECRQWPDSELSPQHTEPGQGGVSKRFSPARPGSRGWRQVSAVHKEPAGASGLKTWGGRFLPQWLAPSPCRPKHALIWNHYGWKGRRQWHSTAVLLPGKSHGRRSLVGCSPLGHYESDMTERLHVHFSLSHIREGNGNPLQWSCLENPRDGGAWWAAVYGVAQGRTRLKWLSSSSSSECKGAKTQSVCASQVALVVKESTCNAGDSRDSLIPGSGRFPGGENGSPLQYSGLESPMDRGA